jgi:hypothetical protein
MDAQEIQGASKQACKYTSFICQFMITYFLYSIFKISLIAIGEENVDPAVDQRMGDILSIMISLSNMIMLYGVSDSIKQSVDRQVREDRIVSTLDDLISDTSMSGDSDDSSSSGDGGEKELNEKLGTNNKSSKNKKTKSKKP